jgi:PAS domain S-box-containing protein
VRFRPFGLDIPRGRPAGWRALAAAASSPRGVTSNLFSALIVFVAALPFVGWRLPSLWLIAMIALIAAERYWLTSRRRGRTGSQGDDAGGFNPFGGLMSAGYSAAAFDLAFFHAGPAQTLGVTLYGVVMFQILARDYARPRRLLANLLPPVLFIVLIQCAAAALLIEQHAPWRILTLVASPIIVFRAFRAVQYHLDRSLGLEREAACRLAESEAKLRGLFELAPLGIALTSMDGRYVEFNKAFCDICGYDENELKALDYWALTPKEYADDEDRQLRSLAEIGKYGPYEKDYVRKDGSLVPIRLNGMLVKSAAGEPYIWSIVEDISAQRQSQAVLIEARLAAEAAARAKSEFLANMSHEIRTPLTGVVGFAGLLEATSGLSDEARRYVSRIATSAEALLLVVNDVLDFSKLEASQVELDPQPFDPRVFLAETADLVRERAARKGLALTLDVDSGLPPLLLADSARLRQVLLNLLTNAIKFTAADAVAVETTYVAEQKRLRVAVRDTGIGVPPDRMERLFQRFSQVDASNTRQYGGTGLGLAISKSIVEMMGGQIGVESEPGVGSTFWFEVAAPAAPGAEAPPTSAPAVDAEVEHTRILLVDDVAVNRELVSAMLAPFDVVIVEAAGGAEAVRASLHMTFDVILMDLQMPGMDGMAATRAIRANEGLNRRTPILALSANVLAAEVAACRAAGMDDHIAKPIDPKDLITKIAHWTTTAQAA